MNGGTMSGGAELVSIIVAVAALIVAWNHRS